MKICRSPIVLCVAAILLAPGRLAALHSPPPVLNPKTYASPSGVYQLTVDSSTLYGQGQGSYRLARAGKETWSKTLPFTLWEAAVTDDGIVAGYAYSNGVQGFPTEEARDKTNRADWPGFFHVVILDAAGNLRLNDRTKRTPCPYPDCDTPSPVALGMFIDSANDRFFVRLADPDLNRQQESWLVFRISDGKRFRSFEPHKLMRGADRSWRILAARPVLGSPLTLLHWYVFTPRDESDDATFTLIDLEGRVAWTLDRPAEYSFKSDMQLRWKFVDYLRGHGAVLDVSKPRQFELWFPADKARVTFEVHPDAKKKTGWSVAETARREYLGVEIPQKVAPVLEPLSLKHLGTITLRAQIATTQPIRNLATFDFDQKGRIGFIRREEVGCSLVVAQPTGEIVSEVAIRDAKDRAFAAWLESDRWVVVDAPYGVKAKAQAWIVRVGDSSPEAIPHFDCAPAKAVAGTGDGGFVVLATQHFEFTMTDELAAFDRDGKRLWSVEADSMKDSALFSPADIAVCTDGTIAVVDTIRKCVQFFSREGKSQRTIDLKKAFGKEPSYPRGIAADRDHGVIVYDGKGSPPIWRLTSDGAVVAKFNPVFKDGRELPVRSAVKRAPDGRLWTTDGDSLLRLTGDGVVDLVLGALPAPDKLGEIAGFATDHRGYFYAASSRTGVVHVFDNQGKFHHICEPLPTDFPSDLRWAEITVAGDGTVCMKSDRLSSKFVRFAADGRRLGVLGSSKWGVDHESWQFKPASQERWIGRYQELCLIDDKGKCVRTIKRRPDGNWLETVGPIGVAADGSAAVCSSSSGRRFFAAPVINLYAPNGDPVRTIPLPYDGYVHRVAYNGRTVVLSGERDVLALDSRGSSVRVLMLSPTKVAPYWEPLFSPDGKELWLREQRSLTIDRYEAPTFPDDRPVQTQPTRYPTTADPP